MFCRDVERKIGNLRKRIFAKRTPLASIEAIHSSDEIENSCRLSSTISRQKISVRVIFRGFGGAVPIIGS